MKEIKLSQNGRKYKGMYVALVDDEDYEKVSIFNWTVMHAHHNCIYAKRAIWENKTCFSLLLHVEILGTRYSKKQIDHIDGNGLNCQKTNMRICNYSQNQMNRKNTKSSSIYKGVRLHNTGKFSARIKLNYKEIYIGSFKSEKRAAMEYNKKAKELFGEFANLNIIL